MASAHKSHESSDKLYAIPILAERFSHSISYPWIKSFQYPFAFQIDNDGVADGKVRLHLKNVIIDSEEPQTPIPLNATSIS